MANLHLLSKSPAHMRAFHFEPALCIPPTMVRLGVAAFPRFLSSLRHFSTKLSRARMHSTVDSPHDICHLIEYIKNTKLRSKWLNITKSKPEKFHISASMWGMGCLHYFLRKRILCDEEARWHHSLVTNMNQTQITQAYTVRTVTCFMPAIMNVMANGLWEVDFW